MVGVVPGQAEQFLIGIFTKFAQGTKGAWEITEPNGLLYDGLKPVLFVSFKISPMTMMKYLMVVITLPDCWLCETRRGVRTRNLTAVPTPTALPAAR